MFAWLCHSTFTGGFLKRVGALIYNLELAFSPYTDAHKVNVSTPQLV